MSQKPAGDSDNDGQQDVESDNRSFQAKGFLDERREKVNMCQYGARTPAPP